MGKPFTPTTINKFKGIVYNPPELAGMDDAESPGMQNWNINPAGFLEKRRGGELKATITGLTGAARVLAIQRMNPSGTLAELLVTDMVKTYSCTLPGVTTPFEVTMPGPVSLSVLQWLVEYGIPGNAYNMTGIRSTSSNGIVGINIAGAATAPVGNSPAGTHLTIFKDRGFALNSLDTAGLESRLWYSAPGNMTDWGGVGLPQNIDLNPGDGDFLVATVPYNDQLIIFKSRKTYVLTADGSPTSWSVRLLNDVIGCTGRGSIKIINGFIYFLSADGVYKTDGTTFQLISDNVRSVTSQNRDYRNPLGVLAIYSAYWDDKYILWMPSTTNTQPVVWDLRAECWVRWLFAGGVDMAGEARYNEFNPDTLYIGGRATNKVWALGASVYQDEGVNYAASWNSRTMEFGDPTAFKRNHILMLDVGPNFNAASAFTVTYSADGIAGAGQPTQSSNINVRKMLKFKGAGRARYLQTAISVTDQYPQYLYGITWMNETKSLIPKNVPV